MVYVKGHISHTKYGKPYDVMGHYRVIATKKTNGGKVIWKDYDGKFTSFESEGKANFTDLAEARKEIQNKQYGKWQVNKSWLKDFEDKQNK